MVAILAFITGLIFGVGLLVSGLTEPQNILAFLDVTSDTWNPNLLIVMGAAVITYGLGNHFIKKMRRPLMEPAFHLPANQKLSLSLIMGSIIFGIGWGLVGYCPGPALVSAAMGLRIKPLVFVGAMVITMSIYGRINRPKRRIFG